MHQGGIHDIYLSIQVARYKCEITNWSTGMEVFSGYGLGHVIIQRLLDTASTDDEVVSHHQIDSGAKFESQPPTPPTMACFK